MSDWHSNAKPPTRAPAVVTVPSVRDAAKLVHDAKSARDAALAETKKRYDAWVAADQADTAATDAYERAVKVLHAAIEMEYPHA